MTKEEIIEGNKIIGHFDGKNFKDPLNYMYDISLDLLVPVLEKIINIDVSEFNYNTTCMSVCRRKIASIKSITINTPIEKVWLAVVEFIKWYNTQNK